MTIVNWRSFQNSVKYAFSGLKYAYSHEQNFRIQTAIALLVFILMGIFDMERRDIFILILIIGSIMVLELINTAMEHFLNVVEPKIHILAKAIKDVMAAAVLIASICAVILGAMIFWPYITSTM
jgi:undecaprenol kinase